MRAPSLRAVAHSLAVATVCASPSLAAERQEIVLRGHAVCLDDADEPFAAREECPDDPSGGWAVRTADGTVHRLSPEDKRVIMLSDVRVRSRELHIEAWPGSKGELAIVHLYSVIDGRLHDPHFYCDVCAIRAHTPGLCWCCQAPFEFREPPREE